MSLYELMGDLLAGASTVLEAGGIQGRDERSQRDLRQIALLNRRLAVMWPQLFASLWRENSALQATLVEVRDRIDQQELRQEDLPAWSEDPIVFHGQLLRALNDAEALLLLHSSQPWAVAARRVFRRGLTDAIRAEEEMVEAGWYA
jgi:hypothetical protein